jgi:hypothetical protein
VDSFSDEKRVDVTREILDGDDGESFSFMIAEEDKTDISDAIYYVDMMLKNSSASFVKKLLHSPLFKKQRSKMNEKSRQLFSEASFIRYIDEYKRLAFRGADKGEFEEHFRGILHVLDLLKQYYNSQSVDEKDAIIRKINALARIPKVVLHHLESLHLGVSNSILDIYFILRGQKATHDRHKIVFGYFGIIHCEFLKRYYVDIVKTHRLEYAVGPGMHDELVSRRIVDIVPLSGLGRFIRKYSRKTASKRVSKSGSKTRETMKYRQES